MDALTRARPITFTVVEPGGQAPPVVWGVTADAVKSVSFRVDGAAVSMRVTNNFYSWQGTPSASHANISNAVATLDDGTQRAAP